MNKKQKLIDDLMRFIRMFPMLLLLGALLVAALILFMF